MSLERAPLERDPDAPYWCDPIAMVVAWLARIFAQITHLKRIRRTTRFKPNWQDHWASLRQCEWLRDQYRAYGAAQLLAGKDLDLSDFIPSTEPPADYGGSCPRTPFEMNRRFLAVARFNAGSEADIRAYAARIAKRTGIDLSNPLAAHGSTDAQFDCAAHHELARVAARVSPRASRAHISSSARGYAQARAPPHAITTSKYRLSVHR